MLRPLTWGGRHQLSTWDLEDLGTATLLRARHALATLRRSWGLGNRECQASVREPGF